MKSKILANILLVLALGIADAATADNRHGQMHYDGRYNHGRSYPVHGYV